MRLSSILWIFVIVCAASALYAVKYRVQGMDEEIVAMKSQIKAEKSALHVLNAEWAYLTRPDRIRKLAEKHLSLAPVSGLQMADVSEIPFPADDAVQLAGAQKSAVANEDSTSASAPTPQLSSGIVPTGGAGYVR